VKDRRDSLNPSLPSRSLTPTPFLPLILLRDTRVLLVVAGCERWTGRPKGYDGWVLDGNVANQQGNMPISFCDQ
jgi:hypothetical protein